MPVLGFTQCKSPGTQEALPSDDALMDTVQRRTFNYFWEGAEPNSGLARERIHMDGVYPENESFRIRWLTNGRTASWNIRLTSVSS